MLSALLNKTSFFLLSFLPFSSYTITYGLVSVLVLLTDKVILRATDGALYSEEAFFVIQVTAKEPPGVVRNRPLTAVGGDKTVIRRTVLDFQSSGSSIHSKIYVLQGNSISILQGNSISVL